MNSGGALQLEILLQTSSVLSSARAVNDSFIASGEFFIELLVISPMPMEESTVWAVAWL